MSISTLGPPARRFLGERLDRLQQSLEDLGQRLRESIAHLIGSQIGEAIRDALDRALHTDPGRSLPMPQPQWRSFGPEDHNHHEEGLGGRHEESDNDGFWHQQEPVPERRPVPVPEERKPSRWRSLLSGLVQLASCWLQRGPDRPSLLKLLGVGAAVGALNLVAGPFLSGIAITIGTAVLLARRADTMPHTVSATR